jgi:hypothetical protein
VLWCVSAGAEGRRPQSKPEDGGPSRSRGGTPTGEEGAVVEAGGPQEGAPPVEVEADGEGADVASL